MRKNNYKGSMTVEASFVVPIFFFTVLFFIYFFLILSVHTVVEESLFETGEFFSQYGIITEIKEPILHGEFQKNLSLNSIHTSCIKGGRFGILLSCDYAGAENEEVTLTANYHVKIPVLFFNIKALPVKQILKARLFIGQDMRNGAGSTGENSNEDDDSFVYITENGTVYHKSKNCSHLRLAIKSISYEAVEQARNIGGGKYKCCERCGKKQGEQGVVFITLDGTRYHTSLQCSGLKRTIQKVRLKEVKDWGCCKRCG